MCALLGVVEVEAIALAISSDGAKFVVRSTGGAGMKVD